MLKVNYRVKYQEWRIIWKRQELNHCKSKYDQSGNSNINCTFCLEETETETHLYIDCRVTQDFYSRALNWWKLFLGGHPPLQLKGPRLFGLENCPPDNLENIFFRACRYTIFKSRYKGPIISLDLFKQLVRDELSVKYRGNRYRRLLERKEEVSAICWHSLAMEGQLLWSLGGELVPVSHDIWKRFTALKTLARHCGGRSLLWKAVMLHAWIERS